MTSPHDFHIIELIGVPQGYIAQYVNVDVDGYLKRSRWDVGDQKLETRRDIYVLTGMRTYWLDGEYEYYNIVVIWWRRAT